MLLGIFTQKTNLEIPKKSNHVFLIHEIKDGKNKRIKAIAELHRIDHLSIYSVNQKTICFFNTRNKIHRGDLIFTASPIEAIMNSENPGSFDMKNYYATKGIHTQCNVRNDYILIGHIRSWDDWMFELREWFNKSFEHHLRGEELGLAKALLLGNTSELSEETKSSFAATGAIHVLAVSGMHIALFAELILWSFGLLPGIMRKSWAILFALIILWTYAGITGFSPSVIRAVTMFTLVNLGKVFQRTGNPNYILLWCGFLMYLFDPACIYDIGFQLSFAAVFGIQTYKQRITSCWTPKSKLFNFVWEHSSVALAAQLFTVPLILYYFHSFPNYFLIANLGIVVVSGIAMYLGFAFLLLNWIPLIGTLLGFIFSLSLRLMNIFIGCIAELPGAVESGFTLQLWALVSVFIVLLWILHSKAPLRQKCAIGLIVLAGLSYNRYQHQMESHLMILQAKRPILLYKRKTHITLFCSPTDSSNNMKRILSDYQKIYPFKTMKTHVLKNNSTIKVKDSEIQVYANHLTVRGKAYYLIDFKSNRNWILKTASKKAQLISAGSKLAY
jgi:competence protein ComEC